MIAPLQLTAWFRTRMVPLVLLTGVLVSLAAPVAYCLRERSALTHLAEQHALRAAAAIEVEIAERPTLWRYASAKLVEQLVVAGLRGAHIRLFDPQGKEVPLDPSQLAPLPRMPLWAHVPVVFNGAPQAEVWVALDAQPLWLGTAQWSMAFAALALLLTGVLYRVPIAAIANAESRIHRLMGRLALTMQEEDRQRMAHDLHDGVGQAVTAARLELLVLRAAGAPSAQVDRIAARLDDALDEVRRATEALAPAPLVELGLARALERHCESFADAAGLRIVCSVPEALPSLPVEIESACYRMVQEALTNTARHAQAKQAWVTVSCEGHDVRLHIADDGQGVDVEDADANGAWSGGQGIAGIRERVRLLGGRLHIQARPSFALDVTLPLPNPGEEPL